MHGHILLIYAHFPLIDIFSATDSLYNLFFDALTFFRWGIFVSKYPKLVIFSCLVITSLSALGFLNLQIESRAEKLWIPPDSPYINDKHWLDINFPRNTRHHSALFVSENDNILTPEYLQQMLELHTNVTQIKAENNKS